MLAHYEEQTEDEAVAEDEAALAESSAYNGRVGLALLCPILGRNAFWNSYPLNLLYQRSGRCHASFSCIISLLMMRSPCKPSTLNCAVSST